MMRGCRVLVGPPTITNSRFDNLMSPRPKHNLGLNTCSNCSSHPVHLQGKNTPYCTLFFCDGVNRLPIWLVILVSSSSYNTHYIASALAHVPLSRAAASPPMPPVLSHVWPCRYSPRCHYIALAGARFYIRS